MELIFLVVVPAKLAVCKWHLGKRRAESHGGLIHGAAWCCWRVWGGRARQPGGAGEVGVGWEGEGTTRQPAPSRGDCTRLVAGNADAKQSGWRRPAGSCVSVCVSTHSPSGETGSLVRSLKLCQKANSSPPWGLALNLPGLYIFCQSHQETICDKI